LQSSNNEAELHTNMETAQTHLQVKNKLQNSMYSVISLSFKTHITKIPISF
jgi:hypothetical protein